MRIDYTFVRPYVLQSLKMQQDTTHFSCRGLQINEYSDGIITPCANGYVGGLYCSGRPVEYSNCYGKYDDGFSVAADEHYNEDILFLGMLYPPWGHCITDHISRAWPFIGNTKPFLTNCKICYTMASESDKMPDNFFTLYEALGINRNRLVRITRPSRFRKVYFPDRSFWHNEFGDGDQIRYYTNEYRKTVDCIRAFLKPTSNNPKRRVYLSRSGWKKGCVDFGEETIERAFVKHFKCEVVRPEQLNLADLVKLLYECEVLVSTDGSIAHNAIFGPDGLKMIIIRKSDFVNFHQPVINEIRDLDVVYIDAYLQGWLFNNRKEPWVGPFYLLVSKQLAMLLGCKLSFSVISLVRYFICLFSMSVRGFLNQYFVK